MDGCELTNKVVKPRKDRRCGWCSEVVPKGVDCNYRSGVCDGDMFSEHMHTECYKALCDTDRDYLMDGFDVGEQVRGTTMQDDPR